MTIQLRPAVLKQNTQDNCHHDSSPGQRCTCSKCSANRGKPQFSLHSWNDEKIIDAFEKQIANNACNDGSFSQVAYSVTRKDVLTFAEFLLTWNLHLGSRTSLPSDQELSAIFQLAQRDLHLWMESHGELPPLVNRHAKIVRSLARRLPISTSRAIGHAPLGAAQRLRDLAAGKIEGEIKQFEYIIAADRIEDLEREVEQLQAQIANA